MGPGVSGALPEPQTTSCLGTGRFLDTAPLLTAVAFSSRPAALAYGHQIAVSTRLGDAEDDTVQKASMSAQSSGSHALARTKRHEPPAQMCQDPAIETVFSLQPQPRVAFGEVD